jgi:IS1 family transposase
LCYNNHMNKLNTADRVKVIATLVEGNSIASTSRMTGISKRAILKLMVKVGNACADFHNREVRDVPAERVQCDEVWAFCHCKARNVKPELKGIVGVGDVWTWTAIDADTKLMISWLVGARDGGYASEFMNDLSSRLSTRVQLTTDGHGAYPDAVNDAFGPDVDYAQLIKIYGETNPGPGRYSPPSVTGTKRETVCGAPEDRHISTSYVERSNLTIRMGIRRYTRLTNGFSKKLENHVAMTTLFFVHYNYCRIHKTLRVTPAMQAGLTDRVWELADLIGLVEAKETAAIAGGSLKRGSYKTKSA